MQAAVGTAPPQWTYAERTAYGQRKAHVVTQEASAKDKKSLGDAVGGERLEVLARWAISDEPELAAGQPRHAADQIGHALFWREPPDAEQQMRAAGGGEAFALASTATGAAAKGSGVGVKAADSSDDARSPTAARGEAEAVPLSTASCRPALPGRAAV